MVTRSLGFADARIRDAKTPVLARSLGFADARIPDAKPPEAGRQLAAGPQPQRREKARSTSWVVSGQRSFESSTTTITARSPRRTATATQPPARDVQPV